MTTPILKHTTVFTPGSFCPSCLANAHAALSDLEAVTSVEVVIPPGHLVVTHDPRQVSDDELNKVAADVTAAIHPSDSK